MIFQNKDYVGFDPKYSATEIMNNEVSQADIDNILKADSELEKLSLQDIYKVINERKDIYTLNIYNLHKLDCDIGNRIIDLGFAMVGDKMPLMKQQVDVQMKILEQREKYFKDTLRLKELVLKKKENIRNEDNNLIEKMIE